MPDTLHRLIYCSRNAIDGDGMAAEREIQEILGAARFHNRAAGVTGALLFTHGCFVQTLEGHRAALEDIFERIQCDERHRDVTVLSFEPIVVRTFPDWGMAYLGDAETGADAVLASAALSGAFARRSVGGDSVLALMHAVVARKRDWAGV